jgi:hemoglobin
MTVHDIIGDEGFSRLVGAFYRRVKTDNLLSPMYPNQDFAGAEQRLRDFLIGRFGGPQTYIQQRGHPRLGMRHSPFKVDQHARDRWMKLMTEALDETKLHPVVDEHLRQFFNDTATFLINHP